MLAESKTHWENIYAVKQPNEVSWFQAYPKTSMEFVTLFGLGSNDRIIDIGGGDSGFVDALLENGFTDVTVLDISANAIARAKERLGEKATAVKWIVADVNAFEPEGQYDFWHDRAAFHFLVTEAQSDRYAALAAKAVVPGGHLVLGTFSENGPAKCSGLDIRRYSETSMSKKFETHFNRIRCITEDHHTPFNTVQNFLFCSFRRKTA